ncbi:LemA family protein [Finegoldia sp. BIOML-A3]|uniref:LemA family protein n=1 Tax=Finegoldia TaxID=150022 RepID=UPI0012AFD615|nr:MULTISPECIES: LemA family protein [Finegoldia]MDU5223648.1 LemA family protein [Finegoldia magna]MDU5237146.1 LemA family protein [Finegoldia magna]MSA99503.1 LemA family protein [Finegoldia sp. BIOML-A3]MSB93567.1 LemA family protein [Finegoldia sp. BIOML-A4]
MDRFLNSEFTAIGIIALIIFIVLIWWVKTSNRFNRYKVVIDESKKNVDIALAKRYDTICEMIKVAKSYAKHESSTFSDVIKLRQNANIKEFNSAIQNQDREISKIFALAEAYPDLKSSQEFINLQDEISDENEQLAAAKRIVNNNISIINQEIVSFPKSVVAKSKGLKEMEFLKEQNIDVKRSINEFDYDVK